MVKKIRIDYSQGRGVSPLVSEILIEEGLLDQIETNFFRMVDKKPSSIFIITDSTTPKIYSAKVQETLSGAEVIRFPSGEKNKTLETVSSICSRLNKLGGDRDAVIVSVGGGVVCDVAGFAASIYKRGLTHFEVPTTLLAQVDASIGGKNGVDTEWGKNQLGTFHQPRGIFVDPETLDTLPHQELMNGIAEIVKSAIIADVELFDELSTQDLSDINKIKQYIERVCKIKADIVSFDETERNLRAVLNYGHTVGHAIESLSDYSISHGLCVIYGMISEGWIATKLGYFSKSDYKKQSELLLSILGSSARGEFDPEALFKQALTDKKSFRSTLKMALPEKIGKMHEENGSYKIPVSKNLFLESVEQLNDSVDSFSS